MGLKIDRKQDKRVVHACTHMLADIPNGVTVCSSELVAGGILQEGTALGGKDAAGLYHVVKTARLTEDATATTKAYKVAKGHHFKVGDFIMLKVGAKAYKITSINTSETLYDTVNVGTTLGAVSYTHLDVYKRQPQSTLSSAAAISLGCLPITNFRFCLILKKYRVKFNVPCKTKLRITSISLIPLAPVSYTHLGSRSYFGLCFACVLCAGSFYCSYGSYSKRKAEQS